MACLGKAVVVLLAREAFFLRGGDDPAVDDQRRRRVVIEGRDAQNRRHAAAAELECCCYMRCCWHKSRTTCARRVRRSSSRMPGNNGRLIDALPQRRRHGKRLGRPAKSLAVVRMQVQRSPMDRTAHAGSRNSSQRTRCDRSTAAPAAGEWETSARHECDSRARRATRFGQIGQLLVIGPCDGFALLAQILGPGELVHADRRSHVGHVVFVAGFDDLIVPAPPPE